VFLFWNQKIRVLKVSKCSPNMKKIEVECKILRKWEILANLVSKSAPIWMKLAGFIHFGALKTILCLFSDKKL
jgi:hypothetical protein